MPSRKESRLDRYFLAFLLGTIRRLPHWAALRLGNFLGRILWGVSKRKVDRAESRCVLALGVGVTVARRIVLRSYANMGRSVVEFVRLEQLQPQLRSLISIEGREHLDEAMKRGRGVLLMTAHMGSWEMAAARMVKEGYPLTSIYTPQRNKGGVEDLIRRQRLEVTGMKLVPSEGFALRESFRELRRGALLTFLVDLDARKEGMRVSFLGLPASMATGLVKMHQKFGAPVVPIVALRCGDSRRHILRIEEILSDRLDEDGNLFGENMENSLRMCNNVVEKWIKAYPDQWMWLLDRWGSTLAVPS